METRLQCKYIIAHNNEISNYVGYLADGTMFDNTYNRSQPVFFILGAHQVIQAFEDAVPILSRGEKARIIASPDVNIYYIN